MVTLYSQDLLHWLLFPEPSFSLGLSQQGSQNEDETEDPIDQDMSDVVVDASMVVEGEHTEHPAVARRSRRLKAVKKGLVGVYQCDERILNRFREGQLGFLNKEGIAMFHSKFTKLVEVMKDTRWAFRHLYYPVHTILAG